MEFLQGVFDSYAGVVLGVVGGALCLIVFIASADRHKCARVDVERREPPKD